MKRMFLLLLALLPALVGNARVNVDFSAHFEEGTTTIKCDEAWAWKSVMLQGVDATACDYLVLDYESSCSFNLILQNASWEEAYKMTCASGQGEALIELTSGNKTFASVVIQNTAPGDINIKEMYFCTEHEYLYPDPQDLEAARDNLIKIYQRYQALSYDMLPGEDFGTYPAELVNALTAALDGALILDDASQNYGNDLTVDELNAMAHAIVDAYLALAEAKHTFRPADGYYRFVCARAFYNYDEETEETTYYTKAMYSKPNGENGWKNIDKADPTFLWTLVRQPDDTYLLQNAGNGLTFTAPELCSSGSAYISFDPINKQDGSYVTAWPLSTEEDIVMFNFRMSTAKAGDYNYVHMNWHNGGTGMEGPMTVWCNTLDDSGASEWYLEPVSDADAEALLDAKAFVRKFTTALEDAKAKVVIAGAMLKEQLITEASQFSSPYSQNDLGNTDGGNLSDGVLIDDNTSTFWHSYWGGGNVDAGVHYLQVELPEPAHGLVEMDITRRKADNDHVTVWGIYGSEYSTGAKDDYELIATIDMPYGASGESRTATFTIPDGKEYPYLRFYAEQTTTDRGYWHVSEFQLYALTENANSQAKHMGEVYTNLVAAIAVAEALDVNEVTMADYEAFMAAYTPFVAMFVDPTALVEAIAKAEAALEVCVEGNNPGEWTSQTLAAINKNINDAKTYVEGGQYTQQQTDDFLTRLGGGNDMVMAAANRVQTDKCYAIRFADEWLYDEMHWSKSNVVNADEGYNLFDTYLCPANGMTLMATDADDVRMGSYMFFIDDADADIAFRFIPVDGMEDTYIIQHQATGLYVQAYGYDSWTALTLNPTLFTINAIGYGENVIRGRDYTGRDMACLHAQLDGQRLVTWHDDMAGTNSGLIIQELTSASGSTTGSPKADFKAGDITTFCYPVSVKPDQGTLYTVAGGFEKDGKVYVALNKVDHAEAGEAVVYISDGTYDPENDSDKQTVSLTIGTVLATEPRGEGLLRGTYDDLAIETPAFLFAEGQCQLVTEAGASIGRNNAFLPAPTKEVDAEGTYDIVLEVGGDITGIADLASRLSERGNIYDTAGRLVMRDATFTTLHTLPKGVYVINGIKVMKR